MGPLAGLRTPRLVETSEPRRRIEAQDWRGSHEKGGIKSPEKKRRNWLANLLQSPGVNPSRIWYGGRHSTRTMPLKYQRPGSDLPHIRLLYLLRVQRSTATIQPVRSWVIPGWFKNKRCKDTKRAEACPNDVPRWNSARTAIPCHVAGGITNGRKGSVECLRCARMGIRSSGLRCA